MSDAIVHVHYFCSSCAQYPWVQSGHKTNDFDSKTVKKMFPEFSVTCKTHLPFCFLFSGLLFIYLQTSKLLSFSFSVIVFRLFSLQYGTVYWSYAKIKRNWVYFEYNSYSGLYAMWTSLWSILTLYYLILPLAYLHFVLFSFISWFIFLNASYLISSWSFYFSR